MKYRAREIYKNISNSCPKCNHAVDRTKRKTIDKVIDILTLRTFRFKRFSCSNCGWSCILSKHSKEIK